MDVNFLNILLCLALFIYTFNSLLKDVIIDYCQQKITPTKKNNVNTYLSKTYNNDFLHFSYTHRWIVRELANKLLE